jgi:hypothetical protein
MTLIYKPATGKPITANADMGERWWLNVEAGFLRPETIDSLMEHNVEKIKARVVVPQHWLVFEDAKENTSRE